MAKNMSGFDKGIRPNGAAIQEQRRFDQVDHPIYPNFETNHKSRVLSNTGWGLSTKYKTAYSQKGSVNREHLKYFDKRIVTKFNGGPTGYSCKQPEKILIDLDPQVYNINYPQESRIPLGSLDMQR